MNVVQISRIGFLPLARQQFVRMIRYDNAITTHQLHLNAASLTEIVFAEEAQIPFGSS